MNLHSNQRYKEILSLKVLLHTFMDALREDDDREINHHGNPMPVDGGNNDLITKSDMKVLQYL